MAEIEAVGSGLGKAFKGKNTAVFVAVGAALGAVTLMMKSGSGSGSTSSGSDVTATQEAQALAQVIQQNQAATGQMMQQMDAKNTEALNAISQSMRDMSSTLGQNIQSLNTAQTAINSKVDTMYSTVHDIQSTTSQAAYSAASKPATSKDPVAITVAAGSPEAAYLKQEYGDKVNIIESTANQFVGKERPQTNAMYQQFLASQGVTPVQQLSEGQLWKY
jgi:excinuclease UvrABC ATPase subunit